jgi:hypothetical protein
MKNIKGTKLNSLEFSDSRVVSNIKWNKQEKKKKEVAEKYKGKLH